MDLPTVIEDRNLEVAEEGAYDRSNPRSLINILPPSMQEHLEASRNHFLNDLSTESIRRNIQHTPEYALCRKVRTAFWLEYDNAMSAGRNMKMTRIWQGVTASSGEFYNLMKKEHFACYIFTKPIKKDIQERTLLHMAYEQIENILDAPHIRKDGTMDAYAAKVKVEIFKHLEERVNGGIVKKVSVTSEQKNINVNVETTATQFVEMKRAEELQKHLADLREKTKDFEAIEASAKTLEEDDDDYN